MSSSASATLAPEIWAVVLAGKDGAYEPIGPDCYRPRIVGGGWHRQGRWRTMGDASEERSAVEIQR